MALAFSRNGGVLSVLGPGGTMTARAVEDGAPRGERPVPPGLGAEALVAVPGQPLHLVAMGERGILLVRDDDLARVAEAALGFAVTGVAVRPDGRVAAAFGLGPYVTLLSVPSLRGLGRFPASAHRPPPGGTAWSPPRVRWVAFSDDGRRVLLAGGGNGERLVLRDLGARARIVGRVGGAVPSPPPRALSRWPGRARWLVPRGPEGALAVDEGPGGLVEREVGSLLPAATGDGLVAVAFDDGGRSGVAVWGPPRAPCRIVAFRTGPGGAVPEGVLSLAGGPRRVTALSLSGDGRLAGAAGADPPEAATLAIWEIPKVEEAEGERAGLDSWVEEQLL